MTIQLTPEMESGDNNSPSERRAKTLQFFGEFPHQPVRSVIDIPNLDALIEEEQRDIEAGLVHDVDEVFEELFAEIQALENSTANLNPNTRSSVLSART